MQRIVCYKEIKSVITDIIIVSTYIILLQHEYVSTESDSLECRCNNKSLQNLKSKINNKILQIPTLKQRELRKSQTMLLKSIIRFH